ncbi:metallophosphoesterase [uncultured Sunxiuqinia sp.]|uniref:metallophosphoesterase n=1 Tax=uncultured Sunxiuqinia sp. TaxID=1573825 RepID=UPI00261A31B1|nr:metallophosphoesterase [uncultured Sunxiuqinia sp.]
MKLANNHIGYWLVVLLGLFVGSCSNDGGDEMTIVLLPDTQTYAEKSPHILSSQIDWIAANADSIDLVLQQGDLTQNNNEQEWTIVREAFSRLDEKVPYVLALGNHDMGSMPGKFADTRNSDLFNSFFPVSTMKKLPAFAGTFEPGKMDNAFYLMEHGDLRWMVLSLEFGPRQAVVDWANELVEQHPSYNVIVNTHCYMYSDSTRQGEGDYWRPQGYGVGAGVGADAVHDGEQLWDQLIRRHANIRFVFSGHILNGGVGNLVSINDAGFSVYQFLANYQEGVKGSKEGGSGFLRILKLNTKNNTLRVRSYSPYTDEYLVKDGHDFTVRDVVLTHE